MQIGENEENEPRFEFCLKNKLALDSREATNKCYYKSLDNYVG